MKVCPCCFDDGELNIFIETKSKEKGVCPYCKKEKVDLIDISELLDFFEEFLSVFKKGDDGQPLIDILKDDWHFFTEEVDANKLLSDILILSKSNLFSFNDLVVYSDEIEECVSYWSKLKDILMWERRYIIDSTVLDEKYGWGGLFTHTQNLLEDEELFRARLHQNDNHEVFQESKMKCPPKEKATSGRANPAGIPYLYLSKDKETTLYEIRATYLDDLSIGIFKPLKGKEIVLVDFNEDIHMYANEGNLTEYVKSVLLKSSISKDLSKPMRRYDSELEYIPTQFICEFIRCVTGANGILFKSSLHKGGENIVLFDQDLVECIKVVKHSVNEIEIKSSELV